MTQTWQSLAYVLCKTTTDWWCVAVTSVVLCNDKLEQAVLSSNNNDRLVVLSNRTSPFMALTEDQQRKFDLTQLAAAWPTQQFCVLAETTWRCWSYLSDLQHDACLLINREWEWSECKPAEPAAAKLQFLSSLLWKRSKCTEWKPLKMKCLDLHSDYQTTAKTTTKLCWKQTSTTGCSFHSFYFCTKPMNSSSSEHHRPFLCPLQMDSEGWGVHWNYCVHQKFGHMEKTARVDFQERQTTVFKVCT